jgi:uncharacterized protein
MTPTILIFLKAPVPGRAKTRLAAGVGDARAMEIYAKLVQRQLAAIPDDWPVEVHFAPAQSEALMRRWVGERVNRAFYPQVDTGLGERLIHAGEGAFARGAEAAFFIGGDCPGLDRAMLQRATAALEADSAVLGPTVDGGYYLLGLSTFQSAVFQDIDWGTEHVADQTRGGLRAVVGAWQELPRLRDVDTVEDWTAVASSFD